jgi:hypothetical protein
MSRFFGGLSVEEMAEVLPILRWTEKRDWSLARVWLHGELRAPHKLPARLRVPVQYYGDGRARRLRGLSDRD